MPSLSFTSLDRLIEPSNTSSSSQAAPPADRSTPFSFYPPLYATPSHQRPPSPTAFSPSPYVLNFKRRAPVVPQQNGGTGNNDVPSTQTPFQQRCNETDGVQGNGAVLVPAELGSSSITVFGNEGASTKAQDILTESDVFEMDLEKREKSPSGKRALAKDMKTVCDGSSAIFDHGSELKISTSNRSFVPNEDSEFFDAADSVFSDSANEEEIYSPNSRPARCLEASTEAKLEKEMSRRIKAEECVAQWQRRWIEMAKQCATIGVSVPFEVDEDRNENSQAMNQEFLVAKLVGEAIARAVVRAEKEEQLEHVIGTKNREISRLWDKLQYLELVNREMSQRNQEVTEVTQRRKKRRQRRQKLALIGFGAVFCLGSAGLVSYKFILSDQAKTWADSFLKSPAGESNPV